MNTPLCLARVPMLLVFILALIAPCLAQQPVEPSWNGKYLSHYLSELKNPDPVKRQLAAESIGSMGSTAAGAVPELAKLLESKDLTDRIAAALALAKIGEAAKPAVPALQKMALSKDVNESKVAQLAVDAIEPPASATVVNFFSSVYVLSISLAVLVGAVVAFILWKRRAPNTPKDKTAAAAKSSENSASPESSTGGTSRAASGAEPGKGSSSAAATPAAPTAVTPQRTRVSRQLPGMDAYVKKQEGPDSVKRELARVQEEYRTVCDRQKELSKIFSTENLTKEPERVRQLRVENDELANQHYRHEIRLKALEVKLLEMLVDEGSTSDRALRERTEATIAQKWDDLRTLCETPAKITWKGEQWVSVPTGSQVAIADLRAHLATYDVSIGERLTAPVAQPESTEADDEAAEAPQAPEKSKDDPAATAADTKD